MTWHYQGKLWIPKEDELEKYVGFVYIITQIETDMKYIGKKILWSRKTLPPLKGKTRKRRKIVESDWKNYYGSSDKVKQLLNENGEKAFHREILYLCKSKGEMGFLEAKEQFDRNVFFDDSYLNGIINCRVHRGHVQSLKNIFKKGFTEDI